MSAPEEVASGPIQIALEALPPALAEVASVSLGTELALGPDDGRALDAPIGASIPITGPGWVLELGLVGGTAQMRSIAATFLTTPEAELSAVEIGEAMTEIVNIVGGMLKRDLGGAEAGITLGLPTSGQVAPAGAATTGIVHFGEHDLRYWLSVVG